MSRLLPAALAGALAVAALLPAALTLPQHMDEPQYAWAAAYYFGRLARLDLRPEGTDEIQDPGWSPHSVHAVSQPFGVRLIYGLALAVSPSPTPPRFLYPVDHEQPGVVPQVSRDGRPEYFLYVPPSADADPGLWLREETLRKLRLVAVGCAALGFALFALRLGWPATAATALTLALPFVRDSLGRAWAEGPLLLALGLCAVAYGTRWLGPACGLAATVKLTALGLWPLAFWRGRLGPRRLSRALGVLSAALVWSALTPPSWFLAGPAYLGVMLRWRFEWWVAYSPSLEPPAFLGVPNELLPEAGFYVAPRYLWPFEYLAALGLVWLARWTWRRLATRPSADR